MPSSVGFGARKMTGTVPNGLGQISRNPMLCLRLPEPSHPAISAQNDKEGRKFLPRQAISALIHSRGTNLTEAKMSPKAKTPRKKAAATSKRSVAAKKAAATRKHRAAGKKAAKTRVRKVAAKKAAQPAPARSRPPQPHRRQPTP